MTRSSVREQAVFFLNQLRAGVAQKVVTDPTCFKQDLTVERWDPVNNRAAIANLEGWLPEIFPQYGSWKNLPWPEDIKQYFGHKRLTWVVNNSPSPDPCFYPQYEGIPIQKRMWDGMVNPFSQFLIGQTDLSIHFGFKRVNTWWENVIRKLRNGWLDDYLIFSEDIRIHETTDPDILQWFDNKHYRIKQLLEEYGYVQGKEDQVREQMKKMRER